MHYDTVLLPIDDRGGFVLATHHGRHQVGGEDTRETGYAAFRSGHVDRPGELADIGSLCTMPRKASRAQAEYHRRAAQGQGELARGGSYSKSMSEMYAQNEVRYLHAAKLAQEDTVRVPRQAFASRVGMVLLGFDPSLGDTTGEELPGVARLVDIPGARILGDRSSSRWPIHPKGKLLQRFSSVQLGRPAALSADGTLVVLPGDPGAKPGSLICRFEPADREGGLVEVGSVAALRAIFALREGWISLADETMTTFDPGGKETGRGDVPRGAMGWGASVSLDSEWIALPADSGSVWVIGRGGGKPRRFNPHRGLRRDDWLRVTISDCGRWLASWARSECAITRLEDGVSWSAARIEDRVHQDPDGDYVVRSSVPGIAAFVGSRLLVARDGAVREVSLDEGPRPFVSEQGKAGARKPIQVPAGAPFEKIMRAARLEAAAGRIRKHHSPAVRMKTKPLRKAGWLIPPNSKAPPTGASRLGGWPDLPRDVAWPLWETRPMAFLAQVNLAEARTVVPDLRLPASGLLSFFLGCGEMTYEKDGDPRPRYMCDSMAGTEAGTRDAWRVIYSPDGAELGRRVCMNSPLPQLFEPCSVRFVKGGRPLPGSTEVAYELLGLDQAQLDDYNELVDLLEPAEEQSLEQLMGHPRLIQGTAPEMMCELSARGLNPWKYPEQSSPEYAGLAAAAAEWGLLLQLTSNHEADYLWGDGGHFYFYGHRGAMEAGDFSGVWVNCES